MSPQKPINTLWLLLLIPCSVVCAQEPDSEQVQLTALLRQLQLMQSTVAHTASQPDTHSRYYFDYQRLNADLSRVQQGINAYLTPQRAQPRDPVELDGGYQQRADSQ